MKNSCYHRVGERTTPAAIGQVSEQQLFSQQPLDAAMEYEIQSVKNENPRELWQCILGRDFLN